MAVKIVVDSSSDISEQEAKQLGVEMIAIPINFGEEDYLDGVDITKEDFYAKLASCDQLPKTSQISAYRFEEVFDECVKNGDEVVAIVLSSKLSSTCDNAFKVAEKYNGKVFVIDSLSATAGMRILVDYALRLVKENKTAKEIYEILEEKKSKAQIRAIIDTLKYLKKGGRISPLLAFAGELMGIKPMIAVIDGKVEVVGKTLGLKKGVALINKDIEKLGGMDLDLPFYVIYSGTGEFEERANKYIEMNAATWGCDPTTIKKNCIGATIGTHIGHGAIGVVFFSK